MSESKSIIITDSSIISFYESNPHLDVVVMNHILIDILTKLSTELNSTVQSSIQNQIWMSLQELSKSVSSIHHNIVSQMHDTKKEYIDSVRLIIDNSALSGSDKLHDLLTRHNDLMIQKMTSALNECVPKNNGEVISKIDMSIKDLHIAMARDTSQLLENIHKDDNAVHQFVSAVDNKFATIVAGFQTMTQTSNDRTHTEIQQLRDKLIAQHQSHEQLSGNMSDFLNKYKHNSSVKGNISESQLYAILQSIFPSDEIIDCSSDTASCDYRVNRKHISSPTILFENKDYSRAVSTEEIKKFERDISNQRQHGIFISQKSNITYKEPFQIDIIDNFIHIYLPNTEYSDEKIKIAVNMIDSLAPRLRQLEVPTTTTVNICQEDLNSMIELYQDFHSQKISIIDTIRASNKQLIDKIESMQLHAINKLLSKNGIYQNTEDFACKICNAFVGKNKASLSAHSRNCKKQFETSNTVAANTMAATSGGIDVVLLGDAAKGGGLRGVV